MKTRSFFLSMILGVASLVWITACSGKKDEVASHDAHEGHEMAQQKEDAPVEATAPRFQVDEAFQKQLEKVFTAYVEMKDALVSGDGAKVKEEAKDTEEALAAVDMKLLTGAAHNDWMAYLSPMQASLKEIAGSEDLDAQRQSFSALSDNLYKSIKAFGLDGKEAFYEYCPMAFDNTGAYWLSDNREIRNPYFGDKMLTCGEVKERLQ